MRDSLLRLFGVLVVGSVPLLAGGPAAVPEPTSLAVTAIGVAGIVLLARKKRGR